MKPKKMSKRLTLSKTTIINLDQKEQNAVKGGIPETEIRGGCTSWHPICVTQPAIICQTQLSVCKCEG